MWLNLLLRKGMSKLSKCFKLKGKKTENSNLQSKFIPLPPSKKRLLCFFNQLICFAGQVYFDSYVHIFATACLVYMYVILVNK